MPMSTKHNTARMRSLATDLVDLRTAAGLNTREAAKLVGMSASTLNRLENGGKIIEPEHVSALCVAYGVTGAERERLLSLSREPHMPGWWETSGEAIPGQLSALVRFESEATRIVQASMLLIPGLLQTAEYSVVGERLLRDVVVLLGHREGLAHVLDRVHIPPQGGARGRQ